MPQSLPSPLDELAPAEQAVLREFLEPVRFASGDRILTAGEEGDALFIVDEGEVRIEVDDAELDTDAVVAHVGPGAMIGEMSLFERLPRSAHAIADTEVAARRLTADALERIGASHPHIGFALVLALGRDTSRKLRATTQQLADILIAGTPDPSVDEAVARAQAAQHEIEAWDEDRIDALLLGIARAVAAEAAPLAAETVRETRLGDVADKTFKNHVASMGIYQALAGRPGLGPVSHDGDRGVTELASPAGVIFAIVPMTNPVATAVFKALISLKARNAVILSFHRAALGVGNRTGELIRNAVVEAGAPADLVQWVTKRASRRTTHSFMAHPDVSMILATGGAGLVRAAYSSGTPALGVGPGNAPAWIRPDADLDAAAAAVVASKSFDNGLICGAEHNLVVDSAVRDDFVAALERSGAAVLDEDETRRFAAGAINTEKGRLTPKIIGQSAAAIAQRLGVRREGPIRLIVVPTDDPRAENPLSGEKMAPLLSLFTVDGEEEGLALCRRLLDQWGRGHTAIIHSTDEALIERFAAAMPASRILVNSPGTQGVVGLTTGLSPSFTLGCGTFGGNSTTDNVSFGNLTNIKRLARYVEPGPEANALHARALEEAEQVLAAGEPA